MWGICEVFFKVEGAELEGLKNCNDNIGSVQINKNTRSLILWTEKGASRLAKKGVIQLHIMVKVENKQSLSPNKFTNAYDLTGEQGKLIKVKVTKSTGILALDEYVLSEFFKKNKF